MFKMSTNDLQLLSKTWFNSISGSITNNISFWCLYFIHNRENFRQIPPACPSRPKCQTLLNSSHKFVRNKQIIAEKRYVGPM